MKILLTGGTGLIGRHLIPCLLEQIEADPDCAFLRELPEYAGLTARWRPKA